jgi:hypothetical protein
MSFSTGSAMDAAIFRELLDTLFHVCPVTADGTITVPQVLWERLSAHTYRDGKDGVIEARKLVLRKALAEQEGEMTRPLIEEMAVVYATEIEELQEQNARLRAALEPFAGLIVSKDTDPDEIQHFGLPAAYFFAARKALANEQEEK